MTRVARETSPIGSGKTSSRADSSSSTFRRSARLGSRPGPGLEGAEARFTKTSRVLASLAGGRADRTWDKRLAELTRPAVLVLDDFGMRELTAPQADDLYELVTERSGKSLILTSNRAPAKAHMFGRTCVRLRLNLHGLARLLAITGTRTTRGRYSVRDRRLR
jgi:IstB-like ATP binding protein